MSKTETVRALNDSGPQLQIVRTITELQRQIEALQPQRQIQSALLELESQTKSSIQQLQKQLAQAQSQSLEGLAEKIATMAQAMEQLSSTAQSAIEEMQQSAEQQALSWSQEQTKVAKSWQTAAEEIGKTTALVEGASKEAKKAAGSVRRWSWRGWVLAVMSGALAGLLTSWLLLWQLPIPTRAELEELSVLRAEQLQLQKNALLGERMTEYLVTTFYPLLIPQRKAEVDAIYQEVGLEPIGSRIPPPNP